MIFQEITSYSPLYDAYVTRLSTVDDRNREYFCLIPRFQQDEERRPKRWRDIRTSALEDLYDAMSRGDEPGEIRPRMDA